MPDVHDWFWSVWEWRSVMQCACCAGHFPAHVVPGGLCHTPPKQKSIACDLFRGFLQWL